MDELIDVSKSTVLIVDDNPQNIQIVNSVLVGGGYSKVLFATSGQDALKIIKEKSIDLILLDIMMPDMDGYEVFKKIKEKDDTNEIPVIFLSAKAYTEDIVKGLEMGAVDYVTKPFDKEILLARVKTHLTIRNQTKLLEDTNMFLKKKIDLEVAKKLQSNAKLNALYEQSSFGISFMDKHGRFMDVNKRFCNMLGYTREEILNLNSENLIFYDDRDSNSKAFKKIVNYVEDISGLEKRCIMKDGSVKWFHSVYTRLKDTIDKDDYYIASVCQDITDRVMLSEELKAKEKMMISQSRHAAMGNMIGMIAHQWKQPLSIIGVIVNNLKLDVELEEREDNGLLDEANEIESQVMYLSQTINDFRDFFKPNKAKILKNVNDVMDQTLSLIGKSIKNNDIEIVKDYNATIKVNMFPNELMQVFINILNNSKDAIVEKHIENPVIEIKTLEDEKNVYINISDNAGGIPEDIIKNIGELYFTTKGEAGTGLGIYMSKMVIEKELHGLLEWKNINNGVVFSISIPKG